MACQHLRTIVRHTSAKSKRSSRLLDKTFCFLSLFILGLWLPVPLFAAVLDETNFDDGTVQGWTGDGVRDPGLQLSQPGPSGDLEDRFLRFVDRASVGGIPGLRIFAPQAFQGDYLQVARQCGSLEFDIRVFDDQSGQLNVRLFFDRDSDGFDQGDAPEVRAFFQLTMPVDETSGWQRVEVPLALLDANGGLPSNSFGAWQMAPGSTASQWNTLLANVDIVHLPMEINSGTFEDIGIDNVRLLTGECPCPSGPPSTRRAGRVDDFAPPQDTALRGSELEWAFPAAVWTGFDEPGRNRVFGHTFANLPTGIVAAELEIRMRPNGEQVSNDTLGIGLRPDGSFAFSSPLSDLPGANGTWNTASNGPTVFNLDLASLPDGGNLLAQLNAERRLDVLVQDDTAVDWIHLRFWTCPAPGYVGGLPHHRSGPIRLLPDLGGNLTVAAEGVEVTGEIRVAAGEIDGFMWTTRGFLSSDNVDEGASLTFSSLHNQGVVSTGLGFEATERGVEVLADFSEIGATARVEALRDGVLVGSAPLSAGSPLLITSSMANGFYEMVCSGNPPGSTTPADGTITYIYVCVDDVISAQFPDGTAVEADTFLFRAEGASTTIETTDEVGLSLAAAPELEITRAAIQKEGLFSHGLGVATLEISPDAVTVANIGPSGDDGVAIRLFGNESFDAEWERLDVDSLPSGARLETVFRSEERNGTSEMFGRLVAVKGDDGVDLSADLTPSGATSQTVEMLLDGEVVDRLEGQPIEIPLAPLAEPQRFQTDVHYTNLGFTPADQGGSGGCDPDTRLPGDPPCLFAGFTFREAFPFVGFTSGASLFSNEIRLIPEDADPVDARAEVVEITGQDLGELHFRSAQAGPAACFESPSTLCLHEDRFQVEVRWRDLTSRVGSGRAIPIARESGYFWFFDADNAEITIKVLDGRSINGHWWVYYGALSDIEYTVTVTDTQTDAVATYFNPSGSFFSVADTRALQDEPPGDARSVVVGSDERPGLTVTAGTVGAADSVSVIAGKQSCVPTSESLCLNGERFRVEVEWEDFQGNTGTETASPLTDDSGTFWFFEPGNVELVVKLLDGRSVNGHWWFFYASLSNVAYTMTVTDTQTNTVRTYNNPLGELQSRGDTRAFP